MAVGLLFGQYVRTRPQDKQATTSPSRRKVTAAEQRTAATNKSVLDSEFSKEQVNNVEMDMVAGIAGKEDGTDSNPAGTTVMITIMIMTDGWGLQQWPTSPITIQQNKSSIRN